jgi:carbon monoxide dehydrogenase subunit G
MATKTHSIRIDAPKQRVWDVLADFGGTYRYNPNVVTSFSTSEANSGLRAARHCDLTFGGASINELIVGWDEGNSYDIEIVDGKRIPPFKKALATFEVAEDGDGTLVTMTLRHSMKYGPIGSLMNRLVVDSQNTKALNLILAGLKHYIETGEEVAKGVIVDTSPVLVTS